MYIKQVAVTVVTGSDGKGTGYSEIVNGRILSIRYVETDYEDGVDFTITTETSGVTVWAESDVNDSATRLPRQATHSTAGVAVQYANSYPVLEPIYVDNERIMIVIASSGGVKTGKFYITVG